MNPADISANLARARGRIAAVCLATGRDPASVRLLVASKTMPAERVADAARAGQLLMGENRAQELRDKHIAVQALLGPSPTVEWHFIGHLQKNKVRMVVGRVAMIHTVDSLDLAREIDRRVPAAHLGPMPILVEVSLAGEAAKASVAPDRCLDLCAAISDLPNVSLRGLMTVPPWSEDPQEATPWFRQLAGLAAEGRAEGLPLHELSMGMTGDYEVAVREGATIVRLGTAIFGPRR